MDDINSVITDEESQEIEDTLHDSMDEACTRIEIVLRKIAKNPIKYTDEQYKRIIWKVMTLYSAKKADIQIMTPSTSFISPNSDIEA